MFGFLKRRTEQSEADAETVRLLAGFANQQLFVLSLNPSGNFQGDPDSKEEIIAWLERNAREAAADKPFDIYSYEEEGQCQMPFFSSSDSVKAFIETDPAHKWKAFTSVGLTGNVLFGYLEQATFSGAKIILDPRTDSERLIPARTLHAVLDGKRTML